MYYKPLLLCIVSAMCMFTSYAQQKLPDSLWTNYRAQKTDSGKLEALWYIIDAYSNFKPDSALLYGEQNLGLSIKSKSAKYQSFSYKQIGDAYWKLGDYPNALTYYIKRLEMDEKENNASKKAITLSNIATIYELENDYDRSLENFQKAEKIISNNRIDGLKSMIDINLCDVYEKMELFPQAFSYGKKALARSQKEGNSEYIGLSYNNIANTYSAVKEVDSALLNYRLGIPFLQKSNNYQVLCETYNGIATQMEQKGHFDSAIYYAITSVKLAKSLQFNNFYLQGSGMLGRYYAAKKKYDSAYYYQSEAALIKDSIFNEEKAKQVQLITIQEEIRQEKIKEAEEKAKEDRSHALQLLTIGLLIPVFFFISVLLSKRKIKARVVELTGILSLLMAFEYITLLIHPAIARFTNDTPVYEMIILIAVATILTPAHHRLEEWLLHRLTTHKKEHIRIVTKKISQKKPD